MLWLLLFTSLQAADGFSHEQWVQSVAAAPDLTSMRSCLAHLEAALVSSSNKQPPGKGAQGSGGQQLLSPDWSRVIAATPAVKGAWLQCGAEVAAAVLDPESARLGPNLAGTAAAVTAAADEAADPAAAAAAAVPDQQQQELAQQKAQARASLNWLPATVPALFLRLAALDACVCYPQLREGYGFESGRDIIVRYRYIVKPCPIFDPPTLEQLLLQEKEAAAAAAAAARQKQQQTASGSASAAVTGDGEDQEGSPESKQQQQQDTSDKPAGQQQEQPADSQQQSEPKLVKQPGSALDILALVHPTPPRPKQQPQAPALPPQQKQKQPAPRKQPKPREGVPTVSSVLAQPLRVAYGYSLQGRGLLQLIRGLPPFPDWVGTWSVLTAAGKRGEGMHKQRRVLGLRCTGCCCMIAAAGTVSV